MWPGARNRRLYVNLNYRRAFGADPVILIQLSPLFICQLGTLRVLKHHLWQQWCQKWSYLRPVRSRLWCLIRTVLFKVGYTQIMWQFDNVLLVNSSKYFSNFSFIVYFGVIFSRKNMNKHRFAFVIWFSDDCWDEPYFSID